MTEAHESHAPTLPEVKDEAGDTPSWVPILGLVLFGVFALMAVMHPKAQRAPSDPIQVVEVAPPPGLADAPAPDAPAPSE